MSAPVVLTRAYLQELQKANILGAIVDYFKSCVVDSATNGDKSYIIDNNELNKCQQKIQQGLYKRIFTDNEIIDAFQIAFPDCKITYGQQWIDRGKFNERGGKAIMIDWS